MSGPTTPRENDNESSESSGPVDSHPERGGFNLRGAVPQAAVGVLVVLALVLAATATARDPDTTIESTDDTTETADDTTNDATATTTAASVPDNGDGGPPPVLSVSGNQLLDLDGNPIRLIGLNRSGAEYACVQNLGIWDGGSDAAIVDAMASWGVNSVRIPLNEHCWLGINEAPSEFGGQTYRDAIVEFVDLLNERNLIAVLDLHWSGPGDELARENAPAPNADHSVDFWLSVASTFSSTPQVIFDLFNEPHDLEWECWRDGCMTQDGYESTGMQSLVDAVRSTGARQPIVVSGLNYSNDLSNWLEMAPDDPLDAMMAGFHLYNFNSCRDVACWDETIAPVAQVVPVATTELGEDTCGSDFILSYMNWADAADISYMGWTFNAWDCNQGPALIVDESGTPTAFGEGFKNHVAEVLGG